MRSMLKAGLLVVTLAAMPFAAQAGTIVGGVVGAVVGGPNIVRSGRHRHCWTNRNGYRRCGWR
jgi:hypothetical protein